MSGDWTTKDERNYGLLIQQIKTLLNRLDRGAESVRPDLERLRGELAERRKRRVWP